MATPDSTTIHANPPIPSPPKAKNPIKAAPKNKKAMASHPPQTQKSLRRISLHPTLTPYRRRVYRALLSVPRGRWTTYSALAGHLNSSARAVGNAMRSNPFAPEVPCHRVLAADGSLGGYKGEWRVSKAIGNGSFREEKMLRLKEEGVQFDSMGKVVGVCFREFVDLGKT